MTRIAPTLTLLAVAALGGGMFVANAINDPASTQVAAPTPAAAAAPAAPPAPVDPNVIDLSQIPVVGAAAAPPEAPTVVAAAPGERTEVSLAGIPVVGAPADAGGAPPGRTEISLADVPVAGAGAPATADAGAPSAYAGRTNDDTMSVAVAVQGDQASGYVCQRGKIEAWLSGTATGGTLQLTSKSGRTELTGTIGATGVDGTVTIDGAESGYTAPATDVATAAANGRADVGKVVARLGR
ncbi:MAG TPA: hypothetical protein VNA11_02395 [Pseudonocardia sp.]|nr:hypothetical protein [Pseudonocardia sp.]